MPDPAHKLTALGYLWRIWRPTALAAGHASAGSGARLTSVGSSVGGHFHGPADLGMASGGSSIAQAISAIDPVKQVRLHS
jgi:hypothetical protein